MARKKKTKTEIKPEIYTDTITYTCPVRGEVTQAVEIKKYPYTTFDSVHEQEIAEISELLSLSEQNEDELL